MERVLGDTNILLRYSQKDHPLHPVTLTALARLAEQGCRVVFARQSFTEFWTVAPRPMGSPNGLGYSPAVAKFEIDELLAAFDRLPGLDAAFPVWLDLVSRYGVSGKTTHDARIVATMRASGVARVLTFNGKDFARSAEIAVETP